MDVEKVLTATKIHAKEREKERTRRGGASERLRGIIKRRRGKARDRMQRKGLKPLQPSLLHRTLCRESTVLSTVSSRVCLFLHFRQFSLPLDSFPVSFFVSHRSSSFLSCIDEDLRASPPSFYYIPPSQMFGTFLQDLNVPAFFSLRLLSPLPARQTCLSAFRTIARLDADPREEQIPVAVVRSSCLFFSLL